MSFNSIDFAIFLPIVFVIYWTLNRRLKLQNFFIVCASYIFYGWWDWRFLTMIFVSTLVDYFIGISLSKQRNESRRKLWLLASLIINLGILGYFKYYNFFLESLVGTFYLFGVEIKTNSLNIILPVGISFYTFQTLSYSIDVYRRKLEHTKDFIAFSAYISFFPQLVAGPIERATQLLPQFYTHRKFDYDKSIDGLRQILWGLFKKMVIADNSAEYANIIFNNSSEHSGSTLILGALFFTFQIYGDFSGYSDIAIGVSRLFGFDLMQNFAFPYFSRDIAEFWRRWHISLSTWFRDYLYIPLGGSRGDTWMKVRNTFLVFIVSGLWHGASWTFIIWGALNAIYFLPLLLLGENRNNLEIVAKGKLFPSVKEVICILITFSFTVFAWIFFRAENLAHAMDYIAEIFSSSTLSLPDFYGRKKALVIISIIFFFFLVEWLGRESKYAIERIGMIWKRSIRWTFYYLIMFLIITFSGQDQQFVYFQF